MANKKTNFTTFFDEVKQKDYAGIKTELLNITNRVTLWNWISGTYEPDSRFWSEINAIAERYGYEKPYVI